MSGHPASDPDPLRRLFAIAKPFAFTDDERHDIAQLAVGWEGSWGSMPADLAQQLGTGLLCVAGVNWLLNERRANAAAEAAMPPPEMPPLAPRRAG